MKPSQADEAKVCLQMWTRDVSQIKAKYVKIFQTDEDCGRQKDINEA